MFLINAFTMCVNNRLMVGKRVGKLLKNNLFKMLRIKKYKVETAWVAQPIVS